MTRMDQSASSVKSAAPPCSNATYIERDLLVANFYFNSFDAGQRFEHQLRCLGFGTDVVAVLLDRFLERGRSADDADFDVVAQNQVQVLAAVLDKADQIAGEA